MRDLCVLGVEAHSLAGLLLRADPDVAVEREYLPGSLALEQEVYAHLVVGGAGQALPQLKRMHVVRPFEAPDRWTHFGAFNWGYAHPWVFGWFAVTEDGDRHLAIVGPEVMVAMGPRTRSQAPAPDGQAKSRTYRGRSDGRPGRGHLPGGAEQGAEFAEPVALAVDVDDRYVMEPEQAKAK